MATVSKKTLPLGGRELRFAALSFRQLDDLKDEVDLLMSAGGANFARAETRAAVVRVAKASIDAAGEPIDEGFLLEHLDTVNFPSVVRAIFDRNGFLAGEGEPGEARAAASPT
jgi:hypothetical protein